MDKVSIIIPVYNAEMWLERCVDSVLSQTYKSIEIILVDDGSADRSGGICDDYASKDDRVRVIHKENAGVSAARNDGIAAAIGEYIAFIDADDYLEFDCIEELVKYSDYDLVVCAYREFGCRELIKGPEIFSEINVVNDIPKLWNKLYSPYWLYVWGKLFKSSIVQNRKVYFDTDMRYLEDFCFVLQYMSYCDNVCLIDNVLVDHLVESTKYSKYHMNFDEFNNHVIKQDSFFNILEGHCGNKKFTVMRKRVFRRHLINFMNYIIDKNVPFGIRCREIQKYGKEKKKEMSGYLKGGMYKFKLYYFVLSSISQLKELLPLKGV